MRRAFNCCAAPPMRIAAVRSAFAAFSLKRAANRGDAGKPRGEIYFPRIFLQRAFIHCLASPARKTCGSLRIAGAKNKRPKKLRRRVSMPPRALPMRLRLNTSRETAKGRGRFASSASSSQSRLPAQCRASSECAAQKGGRAAAVRPASPARPKKGRAHLEC